MDSSHKRCTKCLIVHPISAFSINRRNPDGLDRHCQTCRAAYRKVKYEKNKEKILYKNNLYYRKNQKDVQEWRRIYKKNRRAVDDIYRSIGNLRRRLLSILSGQKKVGITELLSCSLEELLLFLGPKPCPQAHLDHICPLVQGKSAEEISKLFHYSNLRWTTPEENLRKSGNQTEEGLILCKKLLGRDWDES